MTLLLGFAFISGLVTILAPCVWPLLPVILSSSATSGKARPYGVVIGIMLSFFVFTLFIASLIAGSGFKGEDLRPIAAMLILLLGLVLLIPPLGARLEGWVSRLSGRFGGKTSSGSGFGDGFVTGAILGIVWSPCAGPILATVGTLAATQAVSLKIALIILAFVVGVGLPLMIFAGLGRLVFGRLSSLNKYTGRIQQIFGAVLVLTALAIYTDYDRILQAKFLDAFPQYSEFILELETDPRVREELRSL
jgi:cytochrome c-type biogenesis protein